MLDTLIVVRASYYSRKPLSILHLDITTDSFQVVVIQVVKDMHLRVIVSSSQDTS